MDPQDLNIVRVDLLDVYERIKRMTSLRAKALPDIHDEVMVTESHYRFINPMIVNALSVLADDVGVIELADDLPLTKLTDSLMSDGFLDMLKNLEEEEQENWEENEEELQEDFVVYYNLPMNSESQYKLGAVAEPIYQALAIHVLKEWYQGLGLYDDMQLNDREYNRLVRKIRNHSYRFKNKNFKKPYISL